MKLMLTLTFEFLKKNKKATFKQIFEKVSKELKNNWIENSPKEQFQKIQNKKRGELFTYLTTDGRFVMPSKTHWSLVENFSVYDIKKMRVNIGENVEE